MDSRAIIDKSKALQKAAAANESASIIIGILNELKKGVAATEDNLRSTKVGVIVSKFKQHKNPEIARLAVEIIKRWREEVERKRGAPGGKKGSAGTPPSTAASPAPAPGKAATTPSVPPDQRTWKKDKVDVARTKSAIRDNCLGLMYDGLVLMSTAPAEAVLSVAVAVEAAAYANLKPEASEAYKSKMRSLYQNLKNKSSLPLRQRVLGGEIAPERFVVMSSEELKSKERKEEESKMERENMREAQAPQEERSISGSFVCGKCKEKKVAYSQAQTRSADEPMTTFCSCTNCGNRWKFS